MLSDTTRDELAAWLRLSLEPDLGVMGAIGLLSAIGMPEQIYALGAPALSRHLPQELARQLAAPPPSAMASLIDDTLRWAEGAGHHIVTLADPRYPRALLTTPDPPLLLYVRGDPARMAGQALAVVGSRSATAGGAENARAFSRHLAQHGWCIVSGLALGIDAAAHEGALDAGPAGAGTVAVMGTGIDQVYPPRNAGLAERIAAQGALVSELPLGSPAIANHFPRRNRLVAGLAQGVLVVEAARQSGSLITARLAAENGREVFAIPGSIHSPLSRGCHALIRQGAKLVETARDITDELGGAGGSGVARAGAGRAGAGRTGAAGSGAAGSGAAGSGATARGGATARRARDEDVPAPAGEETSAGAAAVIDALGHDPVHLDTLLGRTGLDLATLSARLLELELAGTIARLDGGRFQRLAGARRAAKG
ncbi:DNA protecting protein DprA [Bordetella genomosp. 9]|uniref:DNA protecting protein DprA n=1 Tax=Bordetella genomosp. 9 TaxID=1416803 RepID=A0A261R750_9BORD|nr:DNA-processing protein DprA [Bordetella genomosp. 9]OZI20834.1 DNA protecting protein DprA [Bordetella genomosp. 9]